MEMIGFSEFDLDDETDTEAEVGTHVNGVNGVGVNGFEVEEVEDDDDISDCELCEAEGGDDEADFGDYRLERIIIDEDGGGRIEVLDYHGGTHSRDSEQGNGSSFFEANGNMNWNESSDDDPSQTRGDATLDEERDERRRNGTSSHAPLSNPQASPPEFSIERRTRRPSTPPPPSPGARGELEGRLVRELIDTLSWLVRNERTVPGEIQVVLRTLQDHGFQGHITMAQNDAVRRVLRGLGVDQRVVTDLWNGMLYVGCAEASDSELEDSIGYIHEGMERLRRNETWGGDEMRDRRGRDDENDDDSGMGGNGNPASTRQSGNGSGNGSLVEARGGEGTNDSGNTASDRIDGTQHGVCNNRDNGRYFSQDDVRSNRAAPDICPPGEGNTLNHQKEPALEGTPIVSRYIHIRGGAGSEDDGSERIGPPDNAPGEGSSSGQDERQHPTARNSEVGGEEIEMLPLPRSRDGPPPGGGTSSSTTLVSNETSRPNPDVGAIVSTSSTPPAGPPQHGPQLQNPQQTPGSNLQQTVLSVGVGPPQPRTTGPSCWSRLISFCRRNLGTIIPV